MPKATKPLRSWRASSRSQSGAIHAGPLNDSIAYERLSGVVGKSTAESMSGARDELLSLGDALVTAVVGSCISTAVTIGHPRTPIDLLVSSSHDHDVKAGQEVAARSVGVWDWEPTRLNVPVVSCGRFTLRIVARPEGNGQRRTTVRIVGKREWLKLARST